LRTYIDGLRFDGSTANGVLTYKDGDEISVESTLTYVNNTLKLSYNADDYGTISVADTGDMTIQTFGDGTNDSDLTLVADGAIRFDAADRMYLDTTGRCFFLNSGVAFGAMQVDSSSQLLLYEQGGATTNDFFIISCSTNGATSLSTYDQAGAQGHLTLDIDGDILIDSHTGSCKLKAANGTFTPATADDITTKRYVDARSIVNAMVYG
jgi:hypothetical protein